MPLALRKVQCWACNTGQDCQRWRLTNSEKKSCQKTVTDKLSEKTLPKNDDWQTQRKKFPKTMTNKLVVCLLPTLAIVSIHIAKFCKIVLPWVHAKFGKMLPDTNLLKMVRILSRSYIRKHSGHTRAFRIADVKLWQVYNITKQCHFWQPLRCLWFCT